MCTQTLSEGDRDETQREGGEDAHAAEMDRHYGEETHIPRKTKTHPGTETLVHQKTHSETATEKQSKGDSP